MLRHIALLGGIFTALAGNAWAADTLAIRNVTLIDGTGAAPQANMTVIATEGRFSAVGKDTPVPRSATIIDGTGKFLIPGLMDVHIHVPGSPDNRDRGLSALHSFLYSGVTSVYDAGNNADYIMGLRADERSGAIVSPRIFATGSTITFPGSWGAGSNATLIDSWPEGKAKMDANFARGPDLQKITYENFGTGSNPWVPTFSDDLITNIIGYAREKGVRTTIHISDEAHARVVIAAGVDTFAHPITVGRMSDELPQMIIDSGTIVVSTLAVFDNISGIVNDPSFLDDPEYRAVYSTAEIEQLKTQARPRYTSIGWGSWFQTTLKYATENIKRQHDAGGIIALGTDRAVGLLTHRELELIVAGGISPLDAITIGTLNTAKYLDREEDLGSIEPGKLADMVLLDADPTADIRNARKIARVFKGGVEIDRNALQLPVNEQ
jgi:imidazolonepropionase-like amidohydrolase